MIITLIATDISDMKALQVRESSMACNSSDTLSVSDGRASIFTPSSCMTTLYQYLCYGTKLDKVELGKEQ